MIGMLGNHLLVKIKLSYHVQKNSNALTPRPVVSYFQTKRDYVISYMGIELFLNSIIKCLSICPIDYILPPSTIHNHFLTVDSHNSQQLKYVMQGT